MSNMLTDVWFWLVVLEGCGILFMGYLLHKRGVTGLGKDAALLVADKVQTLEEQFLAFAQKHGVLMNAKIPTLKDSYFDRDDLVGDIKTVRVMNPAFTQSVKLGTDILIEGIDPPIQYYLTAKGSVTKTAQT